MAEEKKIVCMVTSYKKGTIAVSHAGVRSDWMEQDGPADCVREKIFAVGWKIRPGAVFAYRMCLYLFVLIQIYEYLTVKQSLMWNFITKSR